MPAKTKHFSGEIIGNNKILYEIPERKNKRIYYMVECLSCKKQREVRADNLYKQCRSCAATQREKKKNTVWDDLTGKMFGNWEVLQKSTQKGNYWVCKDVRTGTIREVFRGNLTSGRSKGDGSICSWGETQILYILNSNNINYKKEYTFNDLLGKANCPLRFDFGIFSQTNKLLFLIEYQGRQHYNYDKNWNQSYEDWLQMSEYDKKKQEYCKKNNILLLILNDKSNLEAEIIKNYNKLKDK